MELTNSLPFLYPAAGRKGIAWMEKIFKKMFSLSPAATSLVQHTG